MYPMSPRCSRYSSCQSVDPASIWKESNVLSSSIFEELKICENGFHISHELNSIAIADDEDIDVKTMRLRNNLPDPEIWIFCGEVDICNFIHFRKEKESIIDRRSQEKCPL